MSRFQRTRTPAACCCRDGCGTPMGGGDIGVNGSAVGVELLGVSGPQKPEFSSIWIEERLRNGGTAEYRPNPRPALLLEVINDRGESHFHQTMHRGGRALPVPGCHQKQTNNQPRRILAAGVGFTLLYLTGPGTHHTRTARRTRSHAGAVAARQHSGHHKAYCG